MSESMGEMGGELEIKAFCYIAMQIMLILFLIEALPGPRKVLHWSEISTVAAVGAVQKNLICINTFE